MRRNRKIYRRKNKEIKALEEKQKNKGTERWKTFVCVILVIGIIIMLIWNAFYVGSESAAVYGDGVVQIDDNSIFVEDSAIEVNFSQVLLSNHEEVRKLIVDEQEATVSIELEDNLIKKLDVAILKKTQEVSYTAEGCFVVDLGKLNNDDIVQDTKNKMVTIQIDHAYLDDIEIDPYKVVVGEEEHGLLALGKIKLTIEEYNIIERNLKDQLQEVFETEENLKEADEIALEMVKEIYEPIVKAIDAGYSVNIVFKNDK